MLDTQLRRLMDGATRVVASSRAVEIEPQIKKRPDWGKIRSRVIARSLCDEDGERYAIIEDAVETAVDLMMELYVSPSTTPKVGGVKRLGCSMDDLTVEEKTGDKVVVK